MPKMNDPNMEMVKTGSNYSFGAVKIDALQATEYTLVQIIVDKSGSLGGFDRDLEKMIAEIVKSCKKSPRAENLMIRLVTFNHSEEEVHGFRLLETINPDEYANTINTGGETLLFDSTYNGILSVNEYAKILSKNDYLANAIVFCITDGCDNVSKFSPSQIKDLVKKTRKDESLESITVILIGMASDPSVQQYLDHFKTEADITDYIDAGTVSSAKLAKIAKFVSQSISSTSSALGTGGKSASLTF